MIESALFLDTLVYIYNMMIKRLQLLLLLFPLICTAQHSLKGTFAPAENYSWILMYQVTPTGKLYAKDAKVVDGKAEIMLDSTITKGMYRIVYAVPPEGNSFDFIYNGAEDIEFQFSEDNIVTFKISEENKRLANYKNEMTNINAQIQAHYANGEKGMQELEPVFAWQKEVQKKYEEVAKNTMAGAFIKAARPYIPSKVEAAPTYMKNQKAAFFTHLDVTNEAIQKSTFIYDRAIEYISEKEDLDAVIALLEPATPEFQKTILYEIWKNAESSNQPEIANYLSNQRLMSLAKELKDTRLVNQLFSYESLSLGATAPNFSWKNDEEETKWLSEVEGAENYILVFWSSTCSHCLKELPKLQKVIKTLPENQYKVIAFGVEDDIYSWRNESLRLPEFMHIPGMGRWDNEVVKTYNVKQTPTYFMLDSKKVIMGKPEALEDLIELLPKQTVEK